jgi:hypothetical protein
MGWFVTKASAKLPLPPFPGTAGPASAQAGGLTLRMRDDGSVARVCGQ